MLLFLLFVGLSLSFAFGLLIYRVSQDSESYARKFKSDQSLASSQNYEGRALIEGNGNYWTGAKEPKITIVEFADFSCPKCKNSYFTLKQVMEKYGGSVRLVHRDYPVIADYSMDLAHAARCAGEQGLFWQMHGKLYENQPVSDLETVRKLVEQIGVNMIKFDDCTEKSRFVNAIEKNYSDATTLGIAGTPTWFINGHKIEGDLPLSTFQEIIEELQ